MRFTPSQSGKQGPNPRASLDAAVAFSLLFGAHWRRASEPERSMKLVIAIAASLILVGCGPPPPVPKAKHVQQIQQVVAGVGLTNVISESRTLFTRLSHETNVSAVPDYMAGSRYFAGLTALTNLGDVFT